MIRHGVAIVLMALACGAIWWGWSEIRLLRGTVFWEFRLVLLLIAAFVLLSVAERVSAWLEAQLGG